MPRAGAIAQRKRPAAEVVLSDRVVGQAARHGSRVLTMALRMPRSFRMQATRATFLGQPLAVRRRKCARMRGSSACGERRHEEDLADAGLTADDGPVAAELPAVGRFQHHEQGCGLAQPRQQLLETGAVARHREAPPRRAQVHVEAFLGHVDPGEGWAGGGLIHDVQGSALNPCECGFARRRPVGGSAPDPFGFPDGKTDGVSGSEAGSCTPGRRGLPSTATLAGPAPTGN